MDFEDIGRSLEGVNGGERYRTFLDQYESFEGSGDHLFSNEEERYNFLDNYEDLPESVEMIEAMAQTIDAEEHPYLGLFLSYCINNRIEKYKVELDLRQGIFHEGSNINTRHNFLGYKNAGKEITIRGDIGNNAGKLMSDGKLFIDGHAGDNVGFNQEGGEIIAEGDVEHYAGLKKIGGKLKIKGKAYNMLGKEQKGGLIEVGSAANFPGFRKKGGRIHILGNAGRRVNGQAKGGTTIVEGNVGINLGYTNRGSRILVKGNAGDFVGQKMRDGLIKIEGSAGRCAGYIMEGGTIVIEGEVDPESINRGKHKLRNDYIRTASYMRGGDLHIGEGELYLHYLDIFGGKIYHKGGLLVDEGERLSYPRQLWSRFFEDEEIDDSDYFLLLEDEWD